MTVKKPIAFIVSSENQSSYGQSDLMHLRHRELENRGNVSLFHSFPSWFQACFTALHLIFMSFLSSCLLKHVFPSLKPHYNELCYKHRSSHKLVQRGCEVMCCSLPLLCSYLALARRERERLSGGGSVQRGTISHVVRAPAGPHICCSRQPNQRHAIHSVK